MSSNCCGSIRKPTTFRILIFVGAVLILLGIILLVSCPKLLSLLINKEVTLTPESQSYNLWKVTPIPIYMKFYLFNWTNSEDIKNHSKKPILEELGPYVFREHREKIIDGWFPDNNTVTYRQNRTWIFESELSNGTLDDLITTLNIPALTGCYALKDSPILTKAAFEFILVTSRAKYHSTKSVREFIFEGYKDILIDLSKFKPGSAPFDKFGWMYPRNGSADYDGIYNMKTDASELGVLSEWNYANKTPFFESTCGEIGGSAGELFPPNSHNEEISIFSSDICRTLPLKLKEKTSVLGIPGNRYWGDDRMFANSTTEPNNWCFCGNDDGETCYPDGIMNASKCKWGAPIFFSFPHFYKADKSYRSAVIGMNPDETLHQFYLDVEPETGIPLQVRASFQINALLQTYKEYYIMHNMPKIFFPMLWFQQTAQIDEAIRKQLLTVLSIPKIAKLIGYILISTGTSIWIILSIIHLSIRWKKTDDALYLVHGSNQDSRSS